MTITGLLHKQHLTVASSMVAFVENLSPRGQKVTGRLTFILVDTHTHIRLYTHIYV